MRATHLVASLLSLALPATAAMAQTDPDILINRRNLQELERRSIGAPVETGPLRRDLRRDNPLPSTSQGAILDRRLSDLERSNLDRRPPPSPQRGVQPPQLQRSFGDGSELPSAAAARSTAPGSADSITTAMRLASRAERALEGGDAARARSDLTFARRMLDQIGPMPPENPAAARLGTARERLDALEERLEPSP
jgi:hypothetical protein